MATDTVGAASLPDEAIRAILRDRVDVWRQSIGMVAGVVDAGGRRVFAHGRFGGRR